MTHGNMKFDLNTKKPDYVVVPPEIKRFSKVTFGVFSIPIGLNDDNKENIHRQITEKIPNNIIDGTTLGNLLKNTFQDEYFVIFDKTVENTKKTGYRNNKKPTIF